MILNNDIVVYSFHGKKINIYNYRPEHIIIEVGDTEKWIVQKLKN